MEFTNIGWTDLLGDHEVKLIKKLNSLPVKDIGSEPDPIVKGMILKISNNCKLSTNESIFIVDRVDSYGTVYIRSLFNVIEKHPINIKDCRELFKIIIDPRDLDHKITQEWNYIKDSIRKAIRSKFNAEYIALTISIRYPSNVERVRNLGYSIEESDQMDHGYFISRSRSDCDPQELISKLNSEVTRN